MIQFELFCDECFWSNEWSVGKSASEIGWGVWGIVFSFLFLFRFDRDDDVIVVDWLLRCDFEVKSLLCIECVSAISSWFLALWDRLFDRREEADRADEMGETCLLLYSIVWSFVELEEWCSQRLKQWVVCRSVSRGTICLTSAVRDLIEVCRIGDVPQFWIHWLSIV